MARVLKLEGRRRKLFALNSIILNLQKDGFFRTSDFVSKMMELGYTSPRAYLSRYEKHGLIDRVQRGVYRIRPCF